MKKKKIGIFSTGRQDWGIFRNVALALRCSSEFDIQVVAGGMACAVEFGNTAVEIEQDGFPLLEKLSWRVSVDDMVSPCGEISQAVLMTERCLHSHHFDAVMLLGDRFETLAIAQVATLFGVPIIHLHGGEETTGAIDNQFRHAITKLSHIHFASCEIHAERIIQMGERVDRVFNVGAPGLDNLNRRDLPNIADLLADLNLRKQDGAPLLLITYHPPTLDGDLVMETDVLFSVLNDLDAVSIVTLPNNDPGHQMIREAVSKYVAASPTRRVAVSSLGEKRYWSVLKHCDLVVGNSSSGVIEAPAVPVPVINIGRRQNGRPLAPCVINLPKPTKTTVANAVETALHSGFRSSLSAQDSFFGDGHASEKIVEILSNIDLNKVGEKSFCKV
jgi:UDP-hydrolysing UDP-N-acetyl-D-glucosamine 2-epimerase